jgi:imidazolonepropionase-like amidohydrolase
MDRPMSAADVLIVAADRLVDGTGAPARPGAAVAVQGERVVAVDSADALAARFSGARRLNLPGATLLPGLIDSHVHATFSAGPVPFNDVQTDDDLVVGLRGAVNARDALQAGVTTMRDLGGRDRTTLRLRDGIASGVVPGPRLLVCGRPVTIPDGHLHLLGGVAKGVGGVSALVHELIQEGVDAIKVIATGGNMTVTSDPLAAQFTQAEIEAIVRIAEAAGRRVTAHARGVEGIRVSALGGVHNIEHCRMEVPPGEWRFDEALAREIAARGITAAPTLAASYRAFQRQAAGGTVGIRKGAVPLAIRLENAARLRAAGVRVVVGTDAGASMARFDEAVHVEMECLVQAGWTPLEAIGAATLGAATAIGREKEIGSLVPGKLADMVVVGGDPTRTISNVRNVQAVFLGGVLAVETGHATLDARPVPWPSDQVAERSLYRATDVRPAR